MATFTERIKLIFDIDDAPGAKSLRNLRREMLEADSASGKLKAGLGGVGGILKENIAGVAVAAGAALVAFGVKSVKAFQDTALEAGKLSDALGIDVEEASRLMEVAGDLGINVGNLQGAFQKFNKEVGAGKVDLEGFGTELVYAKDGSVDAYESFINAATAIGAIEDPTKRAKAAQETFGRSYGEIAELMEMDAKDLRAALGAVSDEQVIDSDEERKAKAFRDAMDGLGDAVTRVQLAVGEYLVPHLTDLADAAEGLSDGPLLQWASNVSEAVDKITLDFTDVIDRVNLMVDAVSYLRGDDVTYLAQGFGELGKESKGAGESVENAGNLVETMGGQAKTAAVKVKTLEDKWRGLKGELSDEQAAFDLETTFMDLQAAAEAAYIATAEGAADAEVLQREYQGALLDTKASLIDYLADVLALPPERSTKILAAFDEGNLQYIEDQLAILSRNRTMNLSIATKGGIGYGGNTGFGGTLVAGATGGIVTRPTMALIGEAGPEAVVPLNRAPGASPLPSGMGGGGNVTINTQADPNAVIAAIKRYERLNGSSWRR